MFEDYKKINKFALDMRIASIDNPTVHISQLAYKDHIFYLDNYHGYSVSSRHAFVNCETLDETLAKRFIEYIESEMCACYDTGITQVKLGNKTKLRMLKSESEHDIAIRDEWFKLLPKEYSLRYSKEHRCVVVFDLLNIPIALFMEVQLRK